MISVTRCNTRFTYEQTMRQHFLHRKWRGKKFAFHAWIMALNETLHFRQISSQCDWFQLIWNCRSTVLMWMGVKVWINKQFYSTRSIWTYVNYAKHSIYCTNSNSKMCRILVYSFGGGVVQFNMQSEKMEFDNNCATHIWEYWTGNIVSETFTGISETMAKFSLIETAIKAISLIMQQHKTCTKFLCWSECRKFGDKWNLNNFWSRALLYCTQFFFSCLFQRFKSNFRLWTSFKVVKLPLAILVVFRNWITHCLHVLCNLGAQPE